MIDMHNFQLGVYMTASTARVLSGKAYPKKQMFSVGITDGEQTSKNLSEQEIDAYRLQLQVMLDNRMRAQRSLK